MVATGSYHREELEATPRIAGRVGEHFQEGRPAHVVGARAREQIERPARAGVLPDEHAILALVEERSRLLARSRGGEVAHAVLLDRYGVRYRALRRDDLERQPLMTPDG